MTMKTVIAVALIACAAAAQPLRVTDLKSPMVIDGMALDCQGGTIRLVTDEVVQSAVILRGERPAIRNCTVVLEIRQRDGVELPNPNHEGGHAIYIDGAVRALVDNCTTMSNHGDGVYVGNVDQQLPPVVGGRVLGGHHMGGRNGMSIVDAIDFEAVGGTYTSLNKYSTYYGVLIEPANPDDECQDVRIKGCKFEGSMMAHFGLMLWRQRKEWSVVLEDPIFGPVMHRAGKPSTRLIEWSCKGATPPGTFKLRSGGVDVFTDTCTEAQ